MRKAREVLVTGGGGFIGSHLVDALVAEGHRVTALDLWEPQVHGARPRPYRNPGAAYRTGDVRNIRDLRMREVRPRRGRRPDQPERLRPAQGARRQDQRSELWGPLQAAVQRDRKGDLLGTALLAPARSSRAVIRAAASSIVTNSSDGSAARPRTKAARVSSLPGASYFS